MISFSLWNPSSGFSSFMYLSTYYLNAFKTVLVSPQENGSNSMSWLLVLQRVLLKQKQIRKAVHGQKYTIQPWYFNLWIKWICGWYSNNTGVNGTVPMYFVKKMASGLVPILACETVKFRIAHTVLKCPALCPMSLAS